MLSYHCTGETLSCCHYPGYTVNYSGKAPGSPVLLIIVPGRARAPCPGEEYVNPALFLCW